MSEVYYNEPSTNGKVNIITTVGEIEIELWSKECPLACRNFVQLCMEGYYNDTIFHRVVKGFIVQGGDSTGTGMGSDSIYGHPFKDEFHDRLKYKRRGMVGCANADKNDNGSQFFITLSAAPDLWRKNTLFGQVVGKTYFNVMTLEDQPVDKNERPINPHRIIKTEVISNPFDDIVPRDLRKKHKKNKKEKNETNATKNFNLLSFGEEAEEDDGQLVTSTSRTGKSAHDLAKDEKLSSEPAVRKEEMTNEDELDEADDTSEMQLSKVRSRLKTSKSNTKKNKIKDQDDQDGPIEPDQIYLEHLSKAERERAEKLRNEQNALKKELVRAIRGPKKAEVVEEEVIRPEAIQNYIDQRNAYLKRSKQLTKRSEKKDRESETMDMLSRFKTRLSTAKETLKPRAKAEKDMEDLAYEERLRAQIEKDKAYTEKQRKLAEMEAALARDNLNSNTESFGPAMPPDEEKEEMDANEQEEKKDENAMGPELNPKFDMTDYNEDTWMANEFKANEGTYLKEAKDANMKGANAAKGEEWYDIQDPRNVLNRRRRGDATVETIQKASKKTKII